MVQGILYQIPGINKYTLRRYFYSHFGQTNQWIVFINVYDLNEFLLLARKRIISLPNPQYFGTYIRNFVFYNVCECKFYIRTVICELWSTRFLTVVTCMYGNFQRWPDNFTFFFFDKNYAFIRFITLIIIVK